MHYTLLQRKMKESVACIIFNKEKDQLILIMRRDIPVWVLPGGGIEPGETPEQAAVREALEETGCEVQIVRKVAYYEPENRLTKPTHFFECSILSGSLQEGSETRKIGFFPVMSLPKKLVHFYRYWIEDALLFSPEVLKKKIQRTSYFWFVHDLITHPVLVFRFLLTRIGIHINN